MKLYPEGSWLFVNRAEASTALPSPRVYYPACLLLELDKRESLELAERLVRFGRSNDDRPKFVFTFSGSIKRMEE